MRVFLLAGLVVLISSLEAAEEPKALDPFDFMAGIVSEGHFLNSDSAPTREWFFKEGGEQRVAELFVAAAKKWSEAQASKSPTK